MTDDGSYVGRRICIQTLLKRDHYDDVRATVTQHQVIGSTRRSTRKDLVSLRYDDSGEVRDGVDLGSLCYLWIVEEHPFLHPTQPDTEDTNAPARHTHRPRDSAPRPPTHSDRGTPAKRRRVKQCRTDDSDEDMAFSDDEARLSEGACDREDDDEDYDDDDEEEEEEEEDDDEDYDDEEEDEEEDDDDYDDEEEEEARPAAKTARRRTASVPRRLPPAPRVSAPTSMKRKATVEVIGIVDSESEAVGSGEDTHLSFGGEDDMENDFLLELLRQQGFEHRLLPDDAKLPSRLLLQTLPRAAKQQVLAAYQDGHRPDVRKFGLKHVTPTQSGPGIYNIGYSTEDGMEIVRCIQKKMNKNLYAMCAAKVHEKELQSRMDEEEGQADVWSYSGMVTTADKTFHQRIVEEHATGKASGTAVLSAFMEEMGRLPDWSVVVFSPDVVRRVAQEVAKQVDLDGDEAFSLTLCVGEALAGALTKSQCRHGGLQAAGGGNVFGCSTMIKVNLICGMAVARRSPDEVGRELARVIAERSKRHDDPEDEEEAAAANELTSETVTEKNARILEGCNAYAFVKQDLSLVHILEALAISQDMNVHQINLRELRSAMASFAAKESMAAREKRGREAGLGHSTAHQLVVCGVKKGHEHLHTREGLQQQYRDEQSSRGKNSSSLERAVAAAGPRAIDPRTKKPVTEARQKQAINAKKRKSEGGAAGLGADRGARARTSGVRVVIGVSDAVQGPWRGETVLRINQANKAITPGALQWNRAPFTGTMHEARRSPQQSGLSDDFFRTPDGQVYRWDAHKEMTGRSGNLIRGFFVKH